MIRIVSRGPTCLTSLAVSAFLALTAAMPALAQPAPSSQRPRLVVFLTIDQMIPDYFARYGTQFTGGLHRLQSGGVLYTNGYQDHAPPRPLPGTRPRCRGGFHRTPASCATTPA